MLMALKMRRVADDGSGGIVEPLVNWSLIREIVPVDDGHVTLRAVDGWSMTYLNSPVHVEMAIRKANMTGDAIAKVRKPVTPKKCPLCEYEHVKCPNCGAKAMCGAECKKCRACGYVAEGFDEIDAA